jgi:hypothetical protein
MTFKPASANWLSPGFEIILKNEPELFDAYEYPDYPGAMIGDGDWVDLFLDDTGNDPVGRLWFAPDTNGVGVEPLPACNGDHFTRIQLRLRDFHHQGLVPANAFDFVKGEYYCGVVQTGNLTDARAKNQRG